MTHPKCLAITAIVAAIMFIVVGLVAFAVTKDSPIQHRTRVTTTCPSQINGVTYADLPRLTNSGPYGSGDWGLTGSDGNIYNWNICAEQTVCPSDCGTPGTVVCQSCSTSPRSVGILSTQSVSVVPGVNSVSFLYGQGSFSSGCGVNRNANLTVACSAGGSTVPVSVTVEPNCLYSILMRSPYACVTNPIPPNFPLVKDQITALSDLQAVWGSALGWIGNASAGCGWTGITCSIAGSYSIVTAINVPLTNITAPIPDSIWLIGSLNYFNASGSKLGGKLTDAVVNLNNLKVFDISYTNVYGELPKNFLSKVPLRVLLLQSNHFSGTLDPNVCNITTYNLQNNMWACPLPECCGNRGNYMCIPCKD